MAIDTPKEKNSTAQHDYYNEDTTNKIPNKHTNNKKTLYHLIIGKKSFQFYANLKAHRELENKKNKIKEASGRENKKIHKFNRCYLFFSCIYHVELAL